MSISCDFFRERKQTLSLGREATKRETFSWGGLVYDARGSHLPRCCFYVRVASSRYTSCTQFQVIRDLLVRVATNMCTAVRMVHLKECLDIVYTEEATRLYSLWQHVRMCSYTALSAHLQSHFGIPTAGYFFPEGFGRQTAGGPVQVANKNGFTVFPQVSPRFIVSSWASQFFTPDVGNEDAVICFSTPLFWSIAAVVIIIVIRGRERERHSTAVQHQDEFTCKFTYDTII